MVDTPGYYIYLISSLPMLHFDMRAPFSFEGFLEICSGILPDRDVEIVKTAAQPTLPPRPDQCPVEREWRAFDTQLRNELVRIRAARKRLDPGKFLRGDKQGDPSIAHIAMNAYRNPSIIEAEGMLDRERWRIMEEISAGHYFDIDFLVVYAHKLLILERWEKIHTADKSGILEDALRKS